MYKTSVYTLANGNI